MTLRKDDLENGFFLYQDPEKFCFGVDAVLLAHFPAIKDRDRVIDLGCGFAPVPVIMAAEAQKRKISISVTGLEIQEDIAETAKKSIMDNRLTDCIRIVNGDILEAVSYFGAASFTLVTCNPPYRAVGDGPCPPNRAKAIARTELCCTLAEVIAAASRLLVPGGRFDVVYRPGRLAEMIALLVKHSLEPKRMRFVHPSPGKAPEMVLLEAVRGGRPGLSVEPPLFIRGEDGSYTKELLEIYGKYA